MDNAGFGGQVRQDEQKFEYVYILECNNGRIYVGHTSDISERLIGHTKGYMPATRNIRRVRLFGYKTNQHVD